METNSAATVSTASSIDRVAVRIPDFCPADPEMWFCMIERSFEASGVSVEKTKFGYILGALDPRYAAEVRDIIVDPPDSEPYQKLKSELIRRLSSSQEQKTRRLLELEEMGDRKPSQFLRHLRGLAGNAVSDAVLRTLWMGRLPTSMQVILATQKDVELNLVADLADAIADTLSPRTMIAEAAPSSNKSNQDRQDLEALINTKMAQLTVSLRQEILAMRQEFGNDERFSRRSGNRRSGSNMRSRSRSAARRRHDSAGLCWYHNRFGNKANKCIQPCTWSGPAVGNDQGSR
ncbi:uncharacterized protein LOC113464226 [Ceratina calcarata]|uniref:Uncharacterized protein LOC113464226 n=1 Tax=Ceratina calcarata TaxID=156304 RepID=A0AAJ7WA28_9HYME|nr:uncharacterized protein LOC113464226 [Ceratina calcarata]